VDWTVTTPPGSPRLCSATDDREAVLPLRSPPCTIVRASRRNGFRPFGCVGVQPTQILRLLRGFLHGRAATKYLKRGFRPVDASPSNQRAILRSPADAKGGWTATASVDYGSGRPTTGTPREALPQCAATAPPKTSRGRQLLNGSSSQAESSSLRGRSPAGLGKRLNGCHTPRAVSADG